MQLVKPSIEFMDMNSMGLSLIEKAGRTCYKSEDKIAEGTDETFAKMLLGRGHEAMIEHSMISYRIICDRGVTHEIVRHRLFSYAQESTRYCNYKGGVSFIIPPWIPMEEQEMLAEDSFTCEAHTTPDQDWLSAMGGAEMEYIELLNKKWTPQQARSVLPNSLKTEIIVTGNFREWRHFFKLRCAKAAHPQMQEVANMVLADIKTRVPVIFDEFEVKEQENGCDDCDFGHSDPCPYEAECVDGSRFSNESGEVS